MSALLCLLMIITGACTYDPTYFVAAGLFAIGAEIASFRDKKEREKKNEI